MSGRDDRDARLAEAFRSTPPTGARDAGACPADGTLWDAARGDLDPAALRDVLDHVHRCARCEESFAMARALDPAAAGARQARDAEPATPARRPERWALAAAALLTVAATLLWIAGDRERPAANGPAAELRVPAGAAIATPLADGAALPRDAFVLRWEGLPDGAIATVELAGADLRLLHRAEEIAGDSARVPPAALAGRAPGETLYWRVEAVLPDGTRVESRSFRVRIGD